MREKRANLAIGKLVTIVLLIVLLVLILYGVAYGGLNPLVNQIEVRIDNILIMFHMKSGINSQDCFSENVRNLGGGDIFLKEIGAGPKGAVFSVCRNALCNISVDGVGKYKKTGGKFYRYHNGKWENGDMFVILSHLSDIKFYWNLYNVGEKLISKEPVKGIYSKGFTKQFILYGEGNKLFGVTFDFPTEAIWQNGVWRVSVNGGRFNVFRNDDEALDAFIKGVDDNWIDKVYWKEVLVKPGETSYLSNDHGESIGSFLNDGMSIDTILGSKEILPLKSNFAVEKKKLLEESIPSKEDIKKIKDAVKGKIDVDGREFVVSLENNGDEFPIITFTNGKYKYGLEHAGQLNDISNYWTYLPDGTIGGVKLKSYPIYIVKWENGKWTDNNINIFSDFYREPEYYFKRNYSSTLIKKFLDERCK